MKILSAMIRHQIPVLNNPPRDVCYRLGIINMFSNCRILRMVILSLSSVAAGSKELRTLYLPVTISVQHIHAKFPEQMLLANAYQNTSPSVNSNDAVAVCMGSDFQFDFSATDADNDSLVYQFCNAYAGAVPATDKIVSPAHACSRSTTTIPIVEL